MTSPLSPHRLLRHPDSVETAAAEISAACDWAGPGQLTLSFTLRGDIGHIALPPLAAGKRTDHLWEATCFELFIARHGDTGYWEANVSPSTHWAVFRLSGYRENRTDDLAAKISDTKLTQSSEQLSLTAHITLPDLTDTAPQDYRIGLSAIIQNRLQETSFWALAHPPGPPDFHHADCFTGEIMENTTR